MSDTSDSSCECIEPRDQIRKRKYSLIHLESSDKSSNASTNASSDDDSTRNDPVEQDFENPSCSRNNSNKKRAKFSMHSEGADYNIFIGSPVTDDEKVGLRPIMIDACNIAFSHGHGVFSPQGIKVCVDYFLQRNHKVYAFLPQSRLSALCAEHRAIFNRLERQGILVVTPGRWINDKLIQPYDDRYIVQTATILGGIIVSRDNYRDLMNENYLWKKTIQERLLMHTWVGDILLFPLDPLGKNGPSLRDFLKF